MARAKAAPPAGTAEERVATNFVVALERGLAVIRCFDRDRRRMTLSEVAERTGLSRGTARRFLLTLQSLGYVTEERRLFRPTPKVLELGYSYMASLGVTEVARDAIRVVTAELEESSSLAVLDGDEVVYVARIETRRIFSTGLDVGARLPALSSSLGRVLLAGLPEAELRALVDRAPVERRTASTVTEPAALLAKVAEARAQGYAIINGELELGIRSIAVPVRDRAGRTVAALNVGALAARAPLDRMRRQFLPVLRRAAGEIGATLDV